MKKILMIALVFLVPQVELFASDRSNNGCLKGHYALQELATKNPTEFISLPKANDDQMKELLKAVNNSQPIKNVWDQLKWKRIAAHTAIQEDKTFGQLVLQKAVETAYEKDSKRRKLQCILGGTVLTTAAAGYFAPKASWLSQYKPEYLMCGTAAIGALFSIRSAQAWWAALTKANIARSNLNAVRETENGNSKEHTDFTSFATNEEQARYLAMTQRFGFVGVEANRYTTKEVVPTITQEADGTHWISSLAPTDRHLLHARPRELASRWTPADKGKALDPEIIRPYYAQPFTQCNGELQAVPFNERELEGTLKEAYEALATEITSEDLDAKMAELSKKNGRALRDDYWAGQCFHIQNPDEGILEIMEGLLYWDSNDTDATLHFKGFLKGHRNIKKPSEDASGSSSSSNEPANAID